jgi:predicted nucleotidyltransferase
MKKKIIEELTKLENKHDIRIIYAVESGSRAWGFESKDSDYDVRFIYIMPKNSYLSLKPYNGVIEEWPTEILDFAGWDIKKALLLYYKSNPPLYEWLSSPFVYIERFSLMKRLRQLASDYFLPKSCLYHYLRMAENNFRNYLQKERVKIKKYFYALRPLFCCRWIELNSSMPPMEFNRLLEVIDDAKVTNETHRLYERKISGFETDIEPSIPVLNNYIERKIEYYNNYVKNLEKKSSDITSLDSLFIDTLNEVWD